MGGLRGDEGRGDEGRREGRTGCGFGRGGGGSALVVQEGAGGGKDLPQNVPPRVKQFKPEVRAKRVGVLEERRRLAMPPVRRPKVPVGGISGFFNEKGKYERVCSRLRCGL